MKVLLLTAVLSALVGSDAIGHMLVTPGSLMHEQAGGFVGAAPSTSCATFVTDYSVACNLLVAVTAGIAQ